MFILFELFELPIYITILVIAAIISMTIALEMEKEGVATSILSIGIGLLAWRYGYEILDFFQSHAVEAILFTLGYLLVGIIWSFIRWSEKVKSVFRKFNEVKKNFIKEKGEITSDYIESEFKHRIHNAFKGNDGYYVGTNGVSMKDIINKITPDAFKNKSLIISWISYWPLSLIGTLLNNPFRRLFEWIYESLSSLYDKIANKHKNEAIKGLKL